jgi:hypothetical protein
LNEINLAFLKLRVRRVDDGELSGLEMRRRTVVINQKGFVAGRQRFEERKGPQWRLRQAVF